jgi:uncharacterized membrane protein YraQ (UPF0718 family)
MYALYAIAGGALLLSAFFDRRKTWNALKIAMKRLGKILPAMLVMIVGVSLLPIHTSETSLLRFLGHQNAGLGMLFASMLGSITMLPGFIVFPLSGILLQKGVAYMVISAFTTTLMMVGILTYPVEQAYLGHKVTILRNILGFGIALVVALVTGLVFGEVGL